MPETSSSKFGIIAILSTVLILFLIVALAVISSFVRPEEVEDVEIVADPASVISPEIVDPALAIAQLGGLAEGDVVDQAIRQARPGTALATIVYSPRIKAQTAAGDLLLLGDIFTQQGDFTRATMAYQMAGTLATLSPDLSDTTRADIFLQAGLGLIRIEAPVLPKLYLDQAFLLATESSYLQSAYRSAVLSSLSQGYRALGDKAKARETLDLSIAPARLDSTPEQPLVLPVSQDVPLPAEIQTLEAERWQVAQLVVRDLVELGGQTRPTSLARLKDILLQEDTLKSQYFNAALVTEPQLSNKVNILQSKINWQSLKHRLAQQGFGLSIIPEWEAQAPTIEAELTASYNELYRLYADIVVAIPDADDIDRATEEAIKRQVLAGALGQYPHYPGEQLRTQLLQATARLIENQPGTQLRASYIFLNGQVYYTLIRDDELVRVVQ